VCSDALADRHFLLVLDNFEHLLEGAEFVSDLLAQCPDVRVLATSREPLHLIWEQVWPVSPLRLPAGDRVAEVHVVARAPAAAL
jgi:predicted ATPase